ncbi:MAG: GNAT family N-acetyltransferase [Bacilli bacterium]|jgi:GNAT superfamily N-acetyltransferase
MINYSFRLATESDCDLILLFIKKIAAYEKMSDQVKATPASLKEWIFEHKLVEVIFLLNEKKQAVGFALYFFDFSTFVGKAGIHLEDFYLDEEYRGQGLGKKLFLEVVKRAKALKAGRLEWTCLNWNKPSINFYTKVMHATAMDEWTTYRLREDQYQQLIEEYN